MMIFLIRMYCIKHKNFKRQTLFSKEGKKFYKQKLHSGLNVYQSGIVRIPILIN